MFFRLRKSYNCPAKLRKGPSRVESLRRGRGGVLYGHPSKYVKAPVSIILFLNPCLKELIVKFDENIILHSEDHFTIQKLKVYELQKWIITV